jgi:uncharacterized SAM-binding protein YcdF (DUF218 family)
MLTAIRILQIFIHPTFLIFLILLIGTILILKFHKKAGRIMLIAGLLLFYLLGISPIANLLAYPLETKYQPIDRIPDRQVEVIVVLAGGQNYAPGRPASSNVSGASAMRMMETVRLYNLFQDKPKIFISGGSGNPFNKTETSKLMVDLAMVLGVPQENITWETKSRDTYENAKEAKKFIGDKTFILVTSATHMPRAMKAFHQFGLKPIPGPCDYQRKSKYDFFDFVPSSNELGKSARAINEYAGMAWYAVSW